MTGQGSEGSRADLPRRGANWWAAALVVVLATAAAWHGADFFARREIASACLATDRARMFSAHGAVFLCTPPAKPADMSDEEKRLRELDRRLKSRESP